MTDTQRQRLLNDIEMAADIEQLELAKAKLSALDEATAE